MLDDIDTSTLPTSKPPDQKPQADFFQHMQLLQWLHSNWQSISSNWNNSHATGASPNVVQDQSKQKLTLRNMFHLLLPLASEWLIIGILLGVDDGKLPNN